MSDLTIENYVSTDNLLQNCEGVVAYKGEPNTNSVVQFHKGDILLSNIRPYLKKLWLADRDGGCNPDVLVIHTTDSGFLPEFLYYMLSKQSFFDYVMSDVKGMKMPRGNKEHIMRYNIPDIPLSEQRTAVSQARTLEMQIEEAQRVMASCAARKRAVLDKYLNKN